MKEKEFIFHQNLFENNEKEEKEEEKDLKQDAKKEKVEKEIGKKKEEIEKEKEEAQKKKNIKPILIGLNNIGATCYMNATLQCLSNTKELTDYFLTQYKNDSNNILSNEYHILIVNLWSKSNIKAYSPHSFKSIISKENQLFKGIQANDSKDLINFLLDRMHYELNPIKNFTNLRKYYNAEKTNEENLLKIYLEEKEIKYNSIISDTFFGIIETELKCKCCNVRKFNFQAFSFLEFPMEPINEFLYGKKKKNYYNIPDVNIYKCFDFYQREEKLDGDNQLFCSFCNKLCDGIYKTSIYSSPKNLIIYLNRGVGAIYKCNVIFENELDLSNFVKDKNINKKYELYAIICHFGPSSMAGHFVAFCKNIMDNKWYLYNDGEVSKCKEISGMPYILFYKRKQ